MIRTIVISAALAAGMGTTALAQDSGMSFFITSENPGSGADLGGLEGADEYCSALAEAAGVTGKTWRAYLSTSEADARDRIGTGPWVNAEGVTVAESVEELHDEAKGLGKQTALSETGEVVKGKGDDPNRHDILTGSGLDGRLMGDACADWTSGGEGKAWIGHHDRIGGGAHPTSWNNAHETRGCGIEALKSTGGDGLFYCFAVE